MKDEPCGRLGCLGTVMDVAKRERRGEPRCTLYAYKLQDQHTLRVPKGPPAKIDPQVPLAARAALGCNGVRRDQTPCAVGSAHSNV